MSVQSWTVRRLLKAGEYVINTIRLLWDMRRNPPAVLHRQWLPLAEVLLVFEAWVVRQAQKRGTRVVLTVHDVLPHDTGQQHFEAYQRLYPLFDALICHTEAAKTQLVDDFGIAPDKIWVIPHGPLNGMAERSKEDARRQLGLGHEVPVALFFGRIRPYKGLQFLVRSWKRVSESVPDARLIIAGSGTDEHIAPIEEAIRQCELEGEIDSRFYFVPDEELDQLIQAADILVFPYRRITQSGALLKGLGAGKPVVSTRVGGLEEVIEDGKTGLLVNYGDEQALARQIVRLFEDPSLRSQLGGAAQHVMETKYSWEAIAERTLQCYSAVSEC
jgi:glycosyltransferase involved in cell wall biosynthesis